MRAGTSDNRAVADLAAGLVRLSVAVLFAWVIWRTAWISDDAMITFRQVVMTVEGEGITWNPGVRVQAFTHPAWFGILTALYALTEQLYWPAIIAGLILTVISVLMICNFARAQHPEDRYGITGAALVATLLFCPGVVDFATSGLENGLSFFLAVLALRLYAGGERGALFWIVLALLVLNRFDNAVLFLPLALVAAWPLLMKGRIGALIPGVLLLLAWMVFATLYFGSPMPNTYFAKAAAGYPFDERLARGVIYFEDAIAETPFTLVLIGAGIVAAGCSRTFWPMAIGLVLFGGYICYVGGDFMRGRFLALPAVLAVMLLAGRSWGAPTRWVGPAAFGLGLLIAAPPDLSPTYQNRTSVRGIADERGFYFDLFGAHSPNAVWMNLALDEAEPDRPHTAWTGCGIIGLRRLILPPGHYLIDSCALTDPFLARLPAAENPDWRPGHHRRWMPANYDQLVLGLQTQVKGGHGQDLYDEMRMIASAPIWEGDRLVAIARRLVGAGVEAPETYRGGVPGDMLIDFGELDPQSWDTFLSRAGAAQEEQ
ncbi:MAG: hypothetical protein AAGC81_08945 [Pseudomonadota bacterium]